MAHNTNTDHVSEWDDIPTVPLTQQFTLTAPDGTRIPYHGTALGAFRMAALLDAAASEGV